MDVGTADPGSFFQRLRGRPDSEHEMSFNRLAIVVVMMLYVRFATPLGAGMPLLVAYWAASAAVFVYISLDGAVRPWRRAMMMLADLGVISWIMHANGAGGAVFYPLYLWITFGNGFRFGNRYLFAAACVSIADFAAVVLTTPFWRAMPALSAGLLLGLVILPAYAGTLIRKLSAATAAAEEASRAKSYFLASVSHELRTPLTAIIGLGGHLAESGDAEHRATAGTIVTAGRQLLTMINRLLDFSRFDAQGGVAEMKPFDLARLLASVRELMLHQAQGAGLALNLHIDGDAPRFLRGDEAHLRDVLVNLVGNALKFTEAGSITISARVEGGGHRLCLAVTDTGIGIAAEAQARIFGSFAQADDTIIDRYGGTGLGLAICKQLVTLMGGDIGVTSAPGQGSRFWFTARVEPDEQAAPLPGACRLLLYSADADLAQAIGRGVMRRDTREATRALYDRTMPTVLLVDMRLLHAQAMPIEDYPDFAHTLARGAVPILLSDGNAPNLPRDVAERIAVLSLSRPPAAAALDRALATALTLSGLDAAVAQDDAAAADFVSRRILVADDNAMNQKVFGMILGKAGHAVTTASDGERALDLMREQAFDAVLMDVNMPVLNGVEATKLYRFASLGQRRVPIVAITADASPATAQRCLEAGMDACIAKPVEPAQLLALIDELTAAVAAPAARAPAFDPAGVVTPLFPAGGSDADPAIDWRSLDELEELGGRAFVDELLDVYTADAAALMRAVADAVAADDVEAFRTTTHALRSSAANVGATRVAELCLHCQRIGLDEFRDRGARHRDRLAAELARVGRALDAGRPGGTVAAG